MPPLRLLPVALLALALPGPTLAAAETAPAQPVAGEGITTLPAGSLPTVWLQGEPVRAFAPGKLYVFEFWATWCGPCLQAMPHMEELHQRFKDHRDFQIVGVNVMDKTAPEKLLPFLQGKKIAITYTMAADGPAGSAEKGWLEPLAVRGIPHAIALKDGKILWRGHPAHLEPALIEAMLKPDFTPAKTPLTQEQRRAALLPLRTAVKKAAHAGDEAELDKGIRTLAEAGDEALTLDAVESAFRIALIRDNQPLAQALLVKMAALLPASRTAALKAGHLALGTERLDTKKPAFALTCAERALAANAEDIAAMELKAAALFALDRRAEAIALQEKAVSATKLQRKIDRLRAEIAAETNR